MKTRPIRIAALVLVDIIAFIIFISQVACLFLFKVYKVRLLDSSLELVIRGMSLAIGSTIGFIIIFNNQLFELSTFRVFIAYTFLSYFFTMGYRVLYRFYINHRNVRFYNGNNSLNDLREKAIVFGAGEIGKTLVRQSISGKLPFKVLGFIDDADVKSGSLILNKPVYGNIDKLEDALINTRARILIIAITQLSAEKMQQAVSIANGLSREIKIVPSLFELEKNNKRTLDLRNLDYKDLLGRKLIEIDREPIREMIGNKVVLVTGACGSIGSEISRQAKSYNPKKLIILDIDESSLHDCALRLLNYKSEWSDEVVPVLCDIKNKEKIDQIIEQYKPDIIFHAAAYKHVPLIQLYPEEGIRTNVGGSFNVLSSAAKHKVKRVVVISTDKAVTQQM